MRHLFPIKKKEYKRYVITILYEQYRRYRFFFNAFPRERQPQEIVRQGQTLHRFETLWNFPNDKHQLSKRVCNFFSLGGENLARFSLYIYILSWQFRCRNVDKRPFSGVRWNTLSKRHGLFVTSMNLLWFVVRGRISRDGNDSWEGVSGRASGVVPPYRGVTQYSICIRWI